MNANLTGMGRINRIKTWSANVCASRKYLLISFYSFRAFGVFRGKNVFVFVPRNTHHPSPITHHPSPLAFTIAAAGKHLAPVIMRRETGDVTAIDIRQLSKLIPLGSIPRPLVRLCSLSWLLSSNLRPARMAWKSVRNTPRLAGGDSLFSFFFADNFNIMVAFFLY